MQNDFNQKHSMSKYTDIEMKWYKMLYCKNNCLEQDSKKPFAKQAMTQTTSLRRQERVSILTHTHKKSYLDVAQQKITNSDTCWFTVGIDVIVYCEGPRTALDAEANKIQKYVLFSTAWKLDV